MGLRAFKNRQILEQERHAAKRAVGQAVRNLPACKVFVKDGDRVDAGVDSIQALDCGVEKLRRRDLILADKIGKADCVEIPEFLEICHDCSHRSESKNNVARSVANRSKVTSARPGGETSFGDVRAPCKTGSTCHGDSTAILSTALARRRALR
jgi:hypothetical protein